jgi:DNA-binding Lrp family transcriptional regulator
MNPGTLSLDHIRPDQFDNMNGVSIEGDTGLFLALKPQGTKHGVKLYDRAKNRELTTWVNIRHPAELKTNRQAASLRTCMEQRYINHNIVFERTLIVLEHWIAETTTLQNEDDNDVSPGFDDNELEKGRALLRHPAMLYWLGRVFDYGFYLDKLKKTRFVLGEDRNKRLLPWLLIGSAKLSMTNLLKLLGDPATAKDTMVRMALHLLANTIKHLERSFLSPAAMRYSSNIKDTDLLYIPDSPELSKNQSHQLRLMRSDDGGLCSEYAMKDPVTGEMTTKEVKIPVKSVVTTSNYVTVDTALRSGMNILHTKADEDLTKQVKQEKLKLRAGQRRTFPDDELKAWQAALWLIVNEETPEILPMIPFAEDLLFLLENQRSESRRDPDKVCDLIALMGFIRRFQKDPKDRHSADIIDLYMAMQLGLDALTETITELTPKERTIYNVVKEQGTVTTRDVVDQTRIPYETVYKRLERLVARGYLNKDDANKSNKYSLIPNKHINELVFSDTTRYSDPKALMTMILNAIDISSTRHRDTGMNFIDPVTGQYVSVDFTESPAEVNDQGHPVIEYTITVHESDTAITKYPHPDDELTTYQPTEKTLQKHEKKTKEVVDSKKTTKKSPKPIGEFYPQPLLEHLPYGSKAQILQVIQKVSDYSDKACERVFQHLIEDGLIIPKGDEEYSPMLNFSKVIAIKIPNSSNHLKKQCRSCYYYHSIKECPQPNPQLIMPTATYATTCSNYLPRGDAT